MSEMMKYQPQDYEGLVGLAKTVVRSSICAVKSPEDALMILLTGAELGLSAMQSLRGIHVVKGRPVLAADTMGAVVRKSGVCATLRLVESTDERCTYMTRRKDDDHEESVTWTMEDARRAQLGGDNWRKYPKAMLRARALSAICRAVYPDVVAGLYDPDELDALPAQAAEVTQIHREPFQSSQGEEGSRKVHEQPRDRNDDIEDAEFEEAEPAPNSPADVGYDAPVPQDWSEDKAWQTQQRRYRALISEGDVLSRDELVLVHEYTRKILGVTTSKHIDPTRFRKLNDQIQAVAVEDRAEWLRGKIAELAPNPIQAEGAPMGAPVPTAA